MWFGSAYPILMSHKIKSFFFFLLWIWAPSHKSMLVHCLKLKKDWILMYLILWPHIPAFFKTSLIQIAGHKTAFSSLYSNMNITGRKNRISLSKICHRKYDVLLASCLIWQHHPGPDCLNHVIRNAGWTVGQELPSREEIFTMWSATRSRWTIADWSNPAHDLFQLLLSGRRYRALRACTNCLSEGFFHCIIGVLNHDMAVWTCDLVTDAVCVCVCGGGGAYNIHWDCNIVEFNFITFIHG